MTKSGIKALVIGKEQELPMLDVLATVSPGPQSIAAIKKLAPDVVIMDPQTAQKLNALLDTTRTTVAASTHQGMQLVAIEDIYYFEAQHKYVVVYHQKGQLLIEDSLNSLENEFSEGFIRIHRKSLISCRFIESLQKDDDGGHYVTLLEINKKLPVSRRQLPKLRKKMASI